MRALLNFNKPETKKKIWSKMSWYFFLFICCSFRVGGGESYNGDGGFRALKPSKLKSWPKCSCTDIVIKRIHTYERASFCQQIPKRVRSSEELKYFSHNRVNHRLWENNQSSSKREWKMRNHVDLGKQFSFSDTTLYLAPHLIMFQRNMLCLCMS